MRHNVTCPIITGRVYKQIKHTHRPLKLTLISILSFMLQVIMCYTCPKPIFYKFIWKINFLSIISGISANKMEHAFRTGLEICGI